MYKMLIIDDEYLVRTGIRETISWELYDIEIVGEACDGIQGIQQAILLKPDIIITDIKMPLKNGLDMIKEINQTGLDCAAIILSGYKDFDYAKTALENEVYSYLLKPIDNDELIRTVLVALEKLKIRRENEKYRMELEGELPNIKNKVILDILLGNFDDEEIIEGKLNLYRFPLIKQGSCIYCSCDQNESKPVQEVNALKELNNYIIEELQKDNLTYINETFKGFSAFIIKHEENNDIEKYLQMAVKLFEKKNREIVSIGISDYFSSVLEIKGAFHTAKNASLKKIFPAINTISRANQDFKYNKIIQDALNYIAQNYYKDIVIQMVADELYVSSSNVMHMFKDVLGKTFNQCLTDYRMMIAKKLLRENDYKIYEIAEAVGYSDVKYFSQVFKKNVGFTPSQYIMQEKLMETDNAQA